MEKRGENKHNYHYNYHYTLDVISNGSELTEPTVFLSVSRTSRNRSNAAQAESIVEQLGETIPEARARYAILGLSDMTARLVADQKISWACTKAVFCQNNHLCQNTHSIHVTDDDDDGDDGDDESSLFLNNINSGGIWGLPGLLLALHQAGAPEITVVTGNENDASRTEAMVELLKVHRTTPRLHLAAVPLSQEDRAANERRTEWWKMYEDEYVVVHATCPDGKLEQLIYLFTCKKHRNVINYTIVVLPNPNSWQIFLTLWSETENRVLIETADLHEGSEDLVIKILFAVGNDTNTSEAKKDKFRSNVLQAHPTASVIFCCPKERDEGILLRAQKMSEIWHLQLPNDIIWHPPPALLSSCGGPRIDTRAFEPSSSCSVECEEYPLKILNRKDSIKGRITMSEPAADFVQSLKPFFGPPEEECTPTTINCFQQDANEIELDDSDDEHDTSADGGTSRLGCAYLLVLGTGSAAPSPLRGSSGYGLLFPQLIIEKNSSFDQSQAKEACLLTGLVECGEGTLTMLRRHLPLPLDTPAVNDNNRVFQHLRHVKFIWISHSHWDHYGGLPSVVSAIYQSREQHYNNRRDNDQQRKAKTPRLDYGDDFPLLIVAPLKVLRFLDTALNCRRGIKQNNRPSNIHLFKGYTHDQNQTWWPYLSSIQLLRRRTVAKKAPKPSLESSYAYRPFAFWTNVRVDHSCFGAFGFVAGLRVPNDNFEGDVCGRIGVKEDNVRIVTLAFSGDTRPCWRFVEQCRTDCNKIAGRGLNLLLHEASFDDDERDMALEKKHSSLSEALQIAKDALAGKVILTHFSNRYLEYPPMKIPMTERMSPVSPKRQIMFALEGMLIPIN